MFLWACLAGVSASFLWSLKSACPPDPRCERLYGLCHVHSMLTCACARRACAARVAHGALCSLRKTRQLWTLTAPKLTASRACDFIQTKMANSSTRRTALIAFTAGCPGPVPLRATRSCCTPPRAAAAPGPQIAQSTPHTHADACSFSLQARSCSTQQSPALRVPGQALAWASARS